MNQQNLQENLGVRLHTHLAETVDEEKFTLEKFNMRPLEYMESLGWLGSDVWFAHGIHFKMMNLNYLQGLVQELPIVPYLT